MNRRHSWTGPAAVRAASLAVGFIVGVGCNDGRPTIVPVAGRVLIDGQPLKFGHVRLIPLGSRSAMGDLDAEGRFLMTTYAPDDGAAVGKHRVEIAASEAVSPRQIRWHAPAKYANADTSGIVVDIAEATDDLEINLSWEGGAPFVETRPY